MEREEAEELFKKFDSDKSGLLNVDEVSVVGG
jgi:Ca2+-binding EF-hand superfamily protein